MKIFQPDRFLLAEFVRASATLLTGHVLDVGGQDGKRYKGFLTHATTITVLDPDASAHPDIVATAEKMPLADRSIESMLCMEVLMDIYPIHEAIKEMARVLTPGGHLVASVSFMGPLCDEPHHFWRFTPHSLRRLLEPYFTNIQIENRGGYRSQHAQNWIRYWIGRLDLYHRPLLGRFFSLLSMLRGKRAIRRDARDTSATNATYALGFNITATRTL